MAQPAIAAEILQPLDVELDFAPQIALDHVIAVDHLANLQHLGVGQLRYPPLLRAVDLFHDLLGLLAPDALDILQRDHHAVVGRNVDTSDTGQGRYSSMPGRAGVMALFPRRSPESLTVNASTTPNPLPGARHRA